MGFSVALAWFVSGASAQEPLPIDIQQLLAGQGVQIGQKAEVRWLTAESASTRFPDGADAGPTFAAGEMVEVLVVEGARTRVRKGDRYGWVASALLSMEQPAAPALENPLGSLPPLLPAGSVPPSP